ncbi:hypothetical protein P9112_006885 [Eukaryota sp. TZLM1-RC]
MLKACLISLYKGSFRRTVLLIGISAFFLLLFIVSFSTFHQVSVVDSTHDNNSLPSRTRSLTSTIDFQSCSRTNVIYSEFQDVNHFDIADVRRSSTPQLYQVTTHSDESFYFKLQCKEPWGPFKLGTQAFGEYLAFVLADFLDLSVPIPCHLPLALDASLFPSINKQCIYHYEGQPVVIGVATPTMADISTGYRAERYPPNFRNSLQTPFRNVPEEHEHKMMVSDLTEISIMDFLMVNNDRGSRAMTNVFFSNSLWRFILMDNGFMGGSSTLSRSVSLCDERFIISLLEQPPLVLSHMINLTPPKKKVPKTDFCVLPARLKEVILSRQDQLFSFLNDYFVNSLIVQLMIKSFDGEKFCPTEVVDRNLEGCLVESIATPYDVFSALIDGIDKRLSMLLKHYHFCEEEYDSTFRWQI